MNELAGIVCFALGTQMQFHLKGYNIHFTICLLRLLTYLNWASIMESSWDWASCLLKFFIILLQTLPFLFLLLLLLKLLSLSLLIIFAAVMFKCIVLKVQLSTKASKPIYCTLRYETRHIKKQTNKNHTTYKSDKTCWIFRVLVIKLCSI